MQKVMNLGARGQIPALHLVLINSWVQILRLGFKNPFIWNLCWPNPGFSNNIFTQHTSVSVGGQSTAGSSVPHLCSIFYYVLSALFGFDPSITHRDIMKGLTPEYDTGCQPPDTWAHLCLSWWRRSRQRLNQKVEEARHPQFMGVQRRRIQSSEV